MSTAPVQVKSAHTIVVCAIGSSSIFTQTFFSRLGASVLKVNRGEDLMKELQSLRPIGVLLLVSDPDQMQASAWLRQLEQKILFEGMRVVLAVKHDAINPAKLFSSKFLGQFHLVQCLGLRDLVLYSESTTDSDLGVILERIKFAFGLSLESPFQRHFQVQAAHEERLELALPARISQVEDDLHLVIESAVYLQPGAVIKMRLMGLDEEPADVPLKVLENLPSGLRFNFGNSIRAKLEKENLHVLQRLISQEVPSKILNRPMRRAMVITRSLSLRQKLVTALSLAHVESRIPLVRRNIKGDLPPLRPQYLVLEPAALAGQNAAEGLKEIEDFLKLAGPQCIAIVVGKRADWSLPSSERVIVVRDQAVFEDELAQILGAPAEVSRAESVEKHIWFSTDSVRSKVLLILRETSTVVAEAGIVFETPHVFRLWSNIEVKGLDSRAHFVGRVAKVLRQEDSFRSIIKLGPRETPSYLVQVASIASNQTLEKTFSKSLALLSKPEALFVARNMQAQAQNTNTSSGLGSVRKTGAGAMRQAVQTSSGARQGTRTELQIDVDQAEEFGRGAQGRAQRKETAQNRKNLLIAAIVLAIVTLGVWLAVRFGSSSGEDSVYGQSFQKLFEGRGKSQ